MLGLPVAFKICCEIMSNCEVAHCEENIATGSRQAFGEAGRAKQPVTGCRLKQPCNLGGPLPLRRVFIVLPI
jgi:hypothetical protein